MQFLLDTSRLRTRPTTCRVDAIHVAVIAAHMVDARSQCFGRRHGRRRTIHVLGRVASLHRISQQTSLLTPAARLDIASLLPSSVLATRVALARSAFAPGAFATLALCTDSAFSGCGDRGAERRVNRGAHRVFCDNLALGASPGFGLGRALRSSPGFGLGRALGASAGFWLGGTSTGFGLGCFATCARGCRGSDGLAFADRMTRQMRTIPNRALTCANTGGAFASRPTLAATPTVTRAGRMIVLATRGTATNQTRVFLGDGSRSRGRRGRGFANRHRPRTRTGDGLGSRMGPRRAGLGRSIRSRRGASTRTTTSTRSTTRHDEKRKEQAKVRRLLLKRRVE